MVKIVQSEILLRFFFFFGEGKGRQQRKRIYYKVNVYLVRTIMINFSLQRFKSEMPRFNI